MNANLSRFGRAALCAATLMLGPATTSHATVLVPGGTVVPALLAGPAGTLVDSIFTPLTSGTNFLGNLRAAVVLNAGGTLDFYYQMATSGLSGVSLRSMTHQSFMTPSTTDVYTRTDNGGLAFFYNNGTGNPANADRSSGAGVVVGFNFVGPPNVNLLNPGEISRILVVRTNATAYVPGLTTVSDGGATNASGQSFAPLAPFAPSTVPEPASLLLLGSAFAAAGYVARRRKEKSKPTTAI
jgi:hypothetical protein